MQGVAIDGADAGQGGAQARRRSGRDPPHQRAGGQGADRARANRAASAQYATSAFVKEALDKGAELFKWDERKARSGKRVGTKVRGVGVAVSAFVAGSTGFDGLFVIRPDGRMQFQSGIGNLGTALGDRRAPRGRRDAGHAVGEGATSPGATRARTCRGPASRAAARRPTRRRARRTRRHGRKQEAAGDRRQDLGGKPDDYKVANERVSGGGRSMTLAQAAQKAIELGGKSTTATSCPKTSTRSPRRLRRRSPARA